MPTAVIDLTEIVRMAMRAKAIPSVQSLGVSRFCLDHLRKDSS